MTSLKRIFEISSQNRQILDLAKKKKKEKKVMFE
jgi:hypothetical protein